MPKDPHSTYVPATAGIGFDDDGDRWRWLSRLSLVLLVAMVAARVLTSEYLRDPVEPYPGIAAAPRGAGAATGVVLDLLSCVPALLVLFRQALDKRTARVGPSVPLFLLFAGWATASVMWSTDRFGAAVGASHLVAAGAILFAATHLVRDWASLRVVGAACVGLLLCYLAWGLVYQFVDVPEMIENWKNDVGGMRTQAMQSHGWEPDSFAAKQFEAKILRGEMIGFASSPNTFAAIVVMLGTVAAGVAVQRWRTARDKVTPLLGVLLLPVVGFLLWKTQSKAAYATTLLAFGLFFAFALAGRLLIRLRTVIFGLAVVGLITGAAAVAYVGGRDGQLHNDSMNFRWRYWSASARLVHEHPLLGVGWNNFGSYYLSVRLPIAAEEIKDPHNLFVRTATELGFVGLAILVAWLGLHWWRATRPTHPPEAPANTPDAERGIGLAAFLTAAALAIIVNFLAAVDLGYGSRDAGLAGRPVAGNEASSYVLLEFVRRAFYFGILALAALPALGPVRRRIDDRPAPWLLRAMTFGTGLFLLHNLIDFSLFDPSPGPLMLFALLAGTVVGARSADAPEAKPRMPWPRFAVPTLGWVAAAFAFGLPVILAESAAQSADDLMRDRRPGEATAGYASAAKTVPYNASYALRLARALVFAGADRAQVDAAVDAALRTDPRLVDAYLFRARFAASQQAPDAATARYAFDAALALNPNDVAIRTEYADFLRKVGLPRDAAGQYEKALWYNDQYPPDEPKRLPPAKVAELSGFVAELRK